GLVRARFAALRSARDRRPARDRRVQLRRNCRVAWHRGRHREVAPRSSARAASPEIEDVMTTTCAAVRDQISAYVDGELDAGDRAGVSQHLAACGSCREAVDEFREIGDLLRAPHGAPETCPQLGGLAAGVISRLGAEESQSWSAVVRRACEDWHWAFVGAGAFGSAVVSIVLVWAICALGPRPAREDSLAALISNLQAPAGKLLII